MVPLLLLLLLSSANGELIESEGSEYKIITENEAVAQQEWKEQPAALTD